MSAEEHTHREGIHAVEARLRADAELLARASDPAGRVAARVRLALDAGERGRGGTDLLPRGPRPVLRLAGWAAAAAVLLAASLSLLRATRPGGAPGRGAEGVASRAPAAPGTLGSEGLAPLLARLGPAPLLRAAAAPLEGAVDREADRVLSDARRAALGLTARLPEPIGRRLTQEVERALR